MSKIAIIGDLHGNTQWAVHVLEELGKRGIIEVYQVGDFGIWHGDNGKKYLDSVIAVCQKYRIILGITPGNHECYAMIEDPETTDGSIPKRQVLARGLGWEVALLPRGTRWISGGLNFLSLGGAPSIDHTMRKEGRDWWPDEMIRESDLLRLPNGGVDVMLCHDSPNGGTPKVRQICDVPFERSGWPLAGLIYAREGREILDRAFEKVKPRFFFHGHYHVFDQYHDYERDCSFVSLNMDGEYGNVVVFDTETLTNNWDWYKSDTI